MARKLSRGETIGPYTIVQLVGAGGEGEIYEARSADHGKCALKQLRFSAKDPSNRDVIERTFRLKPLVGIRSPYVCQILDLLVCDDLPYVAMEFVEGPTLEQILAKRERLTLPEVIEIIRDTLSGLQWLHVQGLIHRDVKPANIILTKSGTGVGAKLIDLNICLARDLPRVTRRELILGTIEYAAPEMIPGTGATIDERTDVYSVGATMFHTVTGQLPFPDADIRFSPAFIKRFCAVERPSVRDHVPDIPKPIDDCIKRMMAARRADRPNSAAQAWEELQSAAAGVLRDADPLTSSAASSLSLSTESLDATPPKKVCKSKAPRICVESGPLTGITISIPKSGITLGRNKLNPDDTGISRFHFRIATRRRGIDVRDLGSLNGLIHRARRVRRAWLSVGDTLVVGETTLRLCAE